MKLVTEYLADAAKFEQLAALEQDPQVRGAIEETGRGLPQSRRKTSEAAWCATAKTIGSGSKEPGVGSST